VGFDEFEWSAVMQPPLTTVRQPIYEIGQKAAQLLFERLQQRDKEPREIRLSPQLIVRESCGAALPRKMLAPSES
jgi:LacI family transcriptional regulator